MTNWTAWVVAVPLLLAEGLGMLHTLGMQWTLWPRKVQRLRYEEDPTHHPIYLFIPTVNEGRDVLEPTILAAVIARQQYLQQYPHGRVTIVLCNDGFVAHAPNWREPEQVAQQMGVQCITRTHGGGAKAGNIEHARQRVGAVGDALVVVFDADQVAHADFLVDMVAPLCDSRVGWVQSGQYYGNTDNPVARWAHDQQALFYQLLCPGKESLNAAFMCGTNLMLRAAALDEIGGFPQDSVTEDFAASIALHARWRSVYLPAQLAVGLGPLDLASYFRQQRRWAIGTLSVLRTHWRALLLPRGGLRPSQRVQYFLACTHYLSGVRDLIYILAPLAYVWFGLSAVRNGTLATYLWHFLPYWCLSMSAFIYAGWRRTGWRGVVIGFASFPTLVGAAGAVLFARPTQFAVTAKSGKRRKSRGVVVPHVLAWIASAAALVWNWHQGVLLHGPAFFVEVWLAYVTVMLTLSLWLAVHDLLYQSWWWQARREVRAGRSRRAARTRRVRPAWSGLVMGALALVIVAGSGVLLDALSVVPSAPSWFSSTSAPLVSVTPAATGLDGAPFLGIAGPTDSLARDVPALQARLHAHFGVVGRTQNVDEPFDRA
jgi:cellulose synthase/poly-beta-1,6-N-acetylglucosamine synthase-like glycosyltransferase